MDSAKGPMETILTMTNRITEDMREDLALAFNEEESYTSLKQMHPNKASSLNGMPPLLSTPVAYCGPFRYESPPVFP